jgi:hypothetical protein
MLINRKFIMEVRSCLLVPSIACNIVLEAFPILLVILICIGNVNKEIKIKSIVNFQEYQVRPNNKDVAMMNLLMRERAEEKKLLAPVAISLN